MQDTKGIFCRFIKVTIEHAIETLLFALSISTSKRRYRIILHPILISSRVFCVFIRFSMKVAFLFDHIFRRDNVMLLFVAKDTSGLICRFVRIAQKYLTKNKREEQWLYFILLYNTFLEIYSSTHLKIEVV